MLVDNSTVVLGSISEHGLKTKSLVEAAIFGTKSVASAITSSTLSTIAVFAPLVFIEGEIGFLFKDVAITVCYSILSSLMVAVIVIPCLCTRNTKPANRKTDSAFTFNPPQNSNWMDNLHYAFITHLNSIIYGFQTIRSLKYNFKFLVSNKNIS